MSIKFNDEQKFYEVQYSKRHPITRQAVTLRRKGIKSRAEAQRVERELVVLVERKLHEAVSPRWSLVIDTFEKEASSLGLSIRSVENCVNTVRKHTLHWSDRTVDSFSSGELREVITGSMSHLSEHHRKSMLKHFRAVFGFAM